MECEPSDSIGEILCRIALKKNLIKKFKDLGKKEIVLRPCLESAAGVFVKAFREGEFGKVLLDVDLLKKQSIITKEDILPFGDDANVKSVRHESSSEQ